MNAYGPRLECLESRLLLSGVDATGIIGPDLSPPPGLTDVHQPLSTQQQTTTLQLITGESLVLGIPPSDLVGDTDLAGVMFEFIADSGGGLFHIAGTIAAGLYHSDGLVDIEATGDLLLPFEFIGNSLAASLQPGSTFTVEIEQSEFQRAEFTRLQADVEVTTIDGSVLKLEGSVTGKVHEDYKIDFDGSLTVVNDFTKTFSESVTATLKSGGNLGVKVEQSKFKYAELTGLPVLADITIDGSVLKLEGSVTGKVHEDYKIDFDGSLTVVNDFTKTFGKSVTATLKSGGTLGVKVEQSKFKRAEFTDLQVEADITIGDATLGLKLKGSISGKYENDKIDFDGSLDLREDFTYSKDSLTATLKTGGTLGVKVEQSEFKHAEFTGLQVEADVTIGDSVLKLGGKIDGKYEENEFDLSGQLGLRESFEYKQGPMTIRIDANQTLGLDTHAGQLVEVVLDGAAMEADVDRPFGIGPVELAGTITRGTITDGVLNLDADLELRSPLVLRQWPVYVAVVSAEVDFTVQEGELRWFRLRRRVIEVRRPDRFGKRPGRRGFGSLSGLRKGFLRDQT